MKVADITSDTVETYIRRMQTEVCTMEELSKSRLLGLLEQAYFKSDIGMQFMLHYAAAGCDPFSYIVGFHCALEFVQSLQEAEELEEIAKR